MVANAISLALLMESVGSQTARSEWLIFYCYIALSCPATVIDSILLSGPSQLRHQVITKWAALHFYPPILEQLMFLPKPACALDVPGPHLPWHFARKTACPGCIELRCPGCIELRFGNDSFCISITHINFPCSVIQTRLNPIFSIGLLGFMDFCQWKKIAEQLVTGHNAIGAIEQCLLDFHWKPSWLNNVWYRPGHDRTLNLRLVTRIYEPSQELYVTFKFDLNPLFASVVPQLTVNEIVYATIPSFLEAFKQEIRKFD